jgi:hypothetical protein
MTTTKSVGTDDKENEEEKKEEEGRTQYSVFLKSQTPERKHRLGTYTSLERARTMFRRIEKFLQETKGVNDSSLRLDLDQGKSSSMCDGWIISVFVGTYTCVSP